MAAEDEGRTEEPSEYKLEKARKEGRVAKSQEISGALILLVSVLILIAFSKWIFGQCVEIYRFYFSRCSNPTIDITDGNLYTAFLNFFLKITIPVAFVSAIAAFVGNIIQTRGVIFSWKPIEPKFSKIVPHIGNYLKKTIFSGTGLFNVVKSLVKIAVIVFVAYSLIRREIPDLLMVISNGQIMIAIQKIAALCAKLLIIVAIFFLVISIPDYFVQRHDFMESMKMTKQEVKQEYKELEGDPEVKGRLQQMQRDLLSQNIPKAVSESDVVIANPTHFAVALKYVQDEDVAPKVTAKGEDQTALYIRRIAEENNIPIEENKPLARGLYTDVKIGDIIPMTYYNAISVIYSHILNNSNEN